MGGGQRKLESASAALKSSFLFETGSFSLPDSLSLSELFPQPRRGNAESPGSPACIRSALLSPR